RVRLFSEQGPLPYRPRHAAYDLKKLRGKQIVQRIARTRRYHTLPAGLRAMAASWCFATKPSNPCSLPLNLSAQLAARTTRDPSTPTTVPYRLPYTASFTSSASPLEYRQFFLQGFALKRLAHLPMWFQRQ